MRVLMTADTVGGVWTYSLELADALAPHGVEVVLATMGRPLTDDQWAAVRASAVADVRASSFALEWMDEPWADVDAAGEWLLALEDELRPDVVHLGGCAHAALPFRAPAVVVAHSCVLSWWAAVRQEAAPPSWAEYRRRVGEGLAAADAVVAPTRSMLDELARWYGAAGGPAAPPSPILGGLDDRRGRSAHPERVEAVRAVVPNARDAAFVRPAPKEPIVLTAGRLWDDAKNVRVLLAATPSLPPEWTVAVAGGSPADVQVALPAAPGGSGGGDGGRERHLNVRWLGLLGLDAVAGWMGRAAVFALPARYEPFGLAALEAGLSGCALVLGDIPSLREVWGDAATFVDPFDDDHLAAELRRLAGDPALVAELGARARARAATYTPARMAEGYLAVYDRLPSRAGASR